MSKDKLASNDLVDNLFIFVRKEKKRKKEQSRCWEHSHQLSVLLVFYFWDAVMCRIVL